MSLRESPHFKFDRALEGPNRQVVGIEVKGTHSVQSTDFRGIKSLAEDVGERFLREIVLYCGKAVVPFGEQLVAVPVL